MAPWKRSANACPVSFVRKGCDVEADQTVLGFSDAFYKDLSKRYPAEGMPSKCSKIAPIGFVNTNGLIPDVWFEPSEVWEIKGAE